MTATLEQALLAPDIRPNVIDDCYALIQQQVSEMSGISAS